MIATRQRTSLGNVAILQTGFPFKSANYTDDADGVCLIRGDNIVQGKLRWDGVKRWPTNSVDGLRDYELAEGDVVLAMDRPWIEAGLKYAALTKHDLPALLVQRVARLRGGPLLDTGFLRYLIGSQAFTDHVLAVITGTAVPHISASQIKSFSFDCPSLPEQKRIADILGALDDKIELNRRTNETLEAMARALFKSWFVDFDPVQDKAAGRKLAGLDADTARLFPSAFAASPLGEIPKGWRTGAVSELASLSRDSVTPSQFPEELFDHYSIPAFDDGQRAKEELGSTIMSNKFVVQPYCVLLSKLNPRIPRVWLPNEATIRRSICSTEFLVVKPKDGVSRDFLYCLCGGQAFSTEFTTLVTGTSGSHQRVKPESLLAMQVVIPPVATIARFSAVVQPMLNRIATNRRESSELSATRDALLPNLLSGALSVGA